jgi:hypothetical protein
MFKYVYQLLLLHHIVYEKFEDDRAVAINRKCNIKLKKKTKKHKKQKKTNKQTDYDLQNTESENKD